MIDSRLGLVLGVVALVGCTEEVVEVRQDPPVQAPAPPAPVAPSCAPVRLEDGVAVPLDDAALGQCAARALDPLVADAQVVCLAESSHGVSESTVADAVLMRHLIVDLGFRTVAYESDDAGMRALDAAVNDGDEEALALSERDLGRTLGASKEARDLVHALAAARAELPAGQRLSMRGIDVAIQQKATVRAILAYLDRVDPPASQEWKPKLQVSDMVAGQTNAKALAALLESKRSEYLGRAPEADFAHCRTDIESLADGFAFLVSYNAGNFMVGNAEVRDPAMGRYLLRLAGEGHRVIVRAHFGHCAKAFPSQGYDLASGKLAFGKAVADALGPKYRVVGHLYGAGTERRQTGATAPYTVPRSSLDAALDALDAGRVMLYPVRGAAPVDLEKTWRFTRMPEELTRASDQADALLYIDSPTPTTLNWR